MDENQMKKLMDLLHQRANRVESIQKFDEYFETFIRQTLKTLLIDINELLAKTTNETLQLFLEDPYKTSNSRYVAMVQLIYGSQINTFHLDNTKHFPTLVFEGNEFTGKVKITTKIKENGFSSKETDVTHLNQKNTTEMIISFLDQIYKL